MPRFDYHSVLDHRIDNQIIKKEDLRFYEQETAEDFAATEYQTDFIPRSVVRLLSGMHIVLENPSHIPHPNEVFYINSMPGEG